MLSSWINYYVFSYQEEYTKIINKVIITPEEYNKKCKIKCKKIKKPALARYVPTKKFYLLRLSNKQLDEILNVKLKPVKFKEKNRKTDNLL